MASICKPLFFFFDNANLVIHFSSFPFAHGHRMRQILLLEITFKTNRLLKLREKNSIRRLCFTDLLPSLAGMHCCASVDFYRSVSLILPAWFIPYTKPSESYLCIYISKWQRIHTAAISFLVWGDYSLPCNAAGGLIDWGKKKKKTPRGAKQRRRLRHACRGHAGWTGSTGKNPEFSTETTENQVRTGRWRFWRREL